MSVFKKSKLTLCHGLFMPMLLALILASTAKVGQCHESPETSASAGTASNTEVQPDMKPQASIDPAFSRYISYAEMVAAWQDLDPQGLVDTALALMHAESLLRRECPQVPTSDLVRGAALLSAFREDQDSLKRLGDAITARPDVETMQLLVQQCIDVGSELKTLQFQDNEDDSLKRFYRDLVAASLAGDVEEIKSIAEQSQKLSEVNVETRGRLSKKAVEALQITMRRSEDLSTSAVWINELAGYVREIALDERANGDPPSENRKRGGPIQFTAITGAWQATIAQHQQVFVFRPDMTFLFIQRNPVYGFEMSRNEGRYRWQPTRQDSGYLTIYGQNGTMGPLWIQIAPGSQRIQLKFAGLTGLYNRTMMPMW